MSTDIFGLLRSADLVVAASPVFFYGMTAQLKMLIDRCQTLWARKHVHKLKDPLASTRKGLLFSVAASGGRQLFDGIHLTAKYFFDAIDARFAHSLTYRGVEAKGAIRNHKSLMADIDAAIDQTVRPLLKRSRVLFVSPKGACRAPMAAALVQQRFADTIRTDYCGLTPAKRLNPAMLRNMQQQGLDMAYRVPQNVDQITAGMAFDLVIIIGTKRYQSPVSAGRTIHWPVPAPKPGDDDGMLLRQTIEGHTDSLIQALTA